MYSWKVRTFTAKDLFSARPLTDFWKVDKLGQRRCPEKPSPKPTTNNQKKTGCSECKKLRDALVKHLQDYHGEDVDVPIVACHNPVPRKPRNTSSPWIVKTLGIQEEKSDIGEDHVKKVEKSITDKENIMMGVVSKSDKHMKREEPSRKMKQLTLFNMISPKSSGVHEPEKAVPEKKDERLSEDEAKKVSVQKPRTSHATGRTSALEGKPQPFSVKGSESSRSKISNNLFAKKGRETKPDGEIGEPIPERDWKPFKSERCGYIPVADSFGRHPCLWCDKTFSSSSNLSRHVLKHKDGKNKQWFACAECGKKFDRKDGLKRHHLSHKNERPHVCGTCRRRFKHKNHLNEHLKLNRCFKRYSLP